MSIQSTLPSLPPQPLSIVRTDVGTGKPVEGKGVVNPVQTEVQARDPNKQGDTQAMRSEDLQGLVEEANRFVQMTRRELQFTLDEEARTMVVKVVDAESGEVLRQIPAEEMLRFIRHMREQAGNQGVLLQDRA